MDYWTEQQREEFKRLVKEGRTVRYIRKALNLTEDDMVLIPLMLSILEGGDLSG